MIDRIKQILEKRNLSPSRFADQIGVPRSTISHILSGRNNPSLEVVQKILNAFPDIPVDWIMMGKGTYTPQSFTLFDANETENDQSETSEMEDELELPDNNKKEEVTPKETRSDNVIPDREKEPSEKKGSKGTGMVEKVIILYKDGTFKVYNPSF